MPVLVDTTMATSILRPQTSQALKGGFDIESSPAPAHLSSSCVSFCLLAGVGAWLHGYFNAIPGGVTGLQTFLHRFYPEVLLQPTAPNLFCQFGSQRLQLFTSSHFIAAAAFEGSGIPAYVIRSCGRRLTLSFAGFFFTVGAVLQASAKNVAALLAGRIVAGIGLSFATVSALLYISEIAPSHRRGALLNSFNTHLTLGIFMASVVNLLTNMTSQDFGWRLALGLPALPGAILMFIAWRIPESPISLLQRGHIARCRQALTSIHKRGATSQEVRRLEAYVNRTKSCLQPWKAFLKPRHRPQLVLSSLCTILQQLTGINFVVFYGPQLFLNLGSSRKLALIIELVLNFLLLTGSLVTVYLSDRIGRRPLLLCGSILTSTCMLAIGILLTVARAEPAWLPWAIFPITAVFIFSYGFSWAPMGWTYPPEIQNLSTAAPGLALTTFFNVTLSAITAQTVLSTACALRQGLFFGFGVFCALAGLSVYFLFPETVRVPLCDVHETFRTKAAWRRYTG